MRIGAHVSTSGGLDKAIDRAQAIGANAIQIFCSPPQTWRGRTYDEEQAALFRTKANREDINPIFLHGIYLINLASPDSANLARSQDALVHDMKIASQIGSTGVIFHLGSHKGAGYEQVLPQVLQAITNVLENSPEDAWLVMENSAGMGAGIGSKFSELGVIICELANDRLKVCLDTQHAFAAGYNIATHDGLEETLEELDREIGIEKLVAIHANDSKVPLGRGIDRHENIGEGYIGRDGFSVILNHSALKDLPFLLEVPGFAKQGPDKQNISILRSLAGLVPFSPADKSIEEVAI